MLIREIRVSFRGRSTVVAAPTIRNARDVATLMVPILEHEVVEVCLALFLTTKNDVIGYHQVSRGGISATVVNPREVFQGALLANAASVVLVHNHPSGDPTPSSDDFVVTQRVKGAGELIGVELLDHVIIGHAGRYASVRELGRI